MFNLQVGSAHYKMFCYDITPVSFRFHTNYPTSGTQGTFEDEAIRITGQANIVPNHPPSVIMSTDAAPARDLAGTWTASAGIDTVITAGLDPFEY